MLCKSIPLLSTVRCQSNLGKMHFLIDSKLHLKIELIRITRTKYIISFLRIKNEICYCPANTYLFIVNNKNTRKRYEICSKLAIKILE